LVLQLWVVGTLTGPGQLVWIRRPVHGIPKSDSGRAIATQSDKERQMRSKQQVLQITISLHYGAILRIFAKEDFRTIDQEIEWLVEQERRRRNEAMTIERQEAP
jgi:hypothetical protein